jgi:hypothetical protein
MLVAGNHVILKYRRIGGFFRVSARVGPRREDGVKEMVGRDATPGNQGL